VAYRIFRLEKVAHGKAEVE